MSANEPKKPRPLQPEHWMVASQWDQVVEVPRQDGIVGEPQRFVKKETINEVINVHPVVHAIRMLQVGRLNYAIIFAMPISKFYFDHVMGPQEEPALAKVVNIADRVAAESGPEKSDEKVV